jgi:SpoVA protein.
MKLNRTEYRSLYQKASPSSPSLHNVPAAFVTGGAICALGQALKTLFLQAGLTEQSAAAAVSCALIFLGVALTAARLFESWPNGPARARWCPSPALPTPLPPPPWSSRPRASFWGPASRCFPIAGPVLTFGISASVLYGLILWLAGGAA